MTITNEVKKQSKKRIIAQSIWCWGELKNNQKFNTILIDMNNGGTQNVKFGVYTTKGSWHIPSKHSSKGWKNNITLVAKMSDAHKTNSLHSTLPEDGMQWSPQHV